MTAQQNPRVFATLDEVRLVLQRLPLESRWSVRFDDDTSTGAADATPILEVVADSEEEFQHLASLFDREPGHDGEVVIYMSSLEVSIIRPALGEEGGRGSATRADRR